MDETKFIKDYFNTVIDKMMSHNVVREIIAY